MSVTIEDVALRTKLNKGSVSRILNGKGAGYSEQTRQRVLQTAAEMGYQPNALSRALWTGQTHSIGLWVLSENHYSPYFGYLQFCAQRLVNQANYKLITEIFSEAATPTTQGVYWPVDGIISCHLPPSANAYLHATVKNRCPIVALQQSHFPQAEEYPQTDYIDVDLYMGGKIATEHLLAAGCQRVAFVAPPYMFMGSPTRDARGQAYLDVVQEAGKKPECISVPHDTRSLGYEALKTYIEQNGYPDGLFCANDELAIGCYLALQELGIQVSADALLVGFDGLDNARLFPCPISSIVIPIEEMCSQAWDMLMQRIANPDAPIQRNVLPCRLEIRESSMR